MKERHSYAAAGVDIEKADRLAGRFAQLAHITDRPGRVGELGSFAGLFDLSALSCRRPLLVAATDGVGTKLLLAHAQHRLDDIGQDLVAMCVNDILCNGAEPLFFLDYFACGALDEQQAQTVVGSIAKACRLAGCALLGGETAEMPGLYRDGEFDLAGFCVGAVEADHLLSADRVGKDDAIVALASSGAHSNGYSLIRQLLREQEDIPAHILDDLLKPTTIYTACLLPLIRQRRIHALAHITGGGLTGNLARVVPGHLTASIRCDWTLPEVFCWIAKSAQMDTPALLSVYNAGVGMAAVVPKEHLDLVLDSLNATGLESWPIGTIIAREGDRSVLLNE